MANNTKIKGILWVKNYIPPLVVLDNSGMCTEDFYHTLLPQGVDTQPPHINHDGFMHGDNSGYQQRAYDTDIQALKTRVSASNTVIVDSPGRDSAWAENVDILYFCGHGDPSNLHFAATEPYEDNSDDIATYDDIILGDKKTIKWLVLDACQILKSDGIFNRWAKIFSPGGSLRYVFGFHSIIKNDNVRGRLFAEKLNPVPGGSTQGELIRIAWQYACEETEDGEWAILRAGKETGSPLVDDRWTDATLPDDPTVVAGGTQFFTYQKRIGAVLTTPEILNG